MIKLSALLSGMQAVFGHSCPHCGRDYTVTVLPVDDKWQINMVHQCTEAKWNRNHQSAPVDAENDLSTAE